MRIINKETVLNLIVLIVILFLWFMAGRSFVNDLNKSLSPSKDIEYCIGVVGSGSKYTAKVEIKDEKWKDLTSDQRNEIVEECLDTADLPSDDSKKFTMIGIDKTTSKQIFTYDNVTQNVHFYGL